MLTYLIKNGLVFDGIGSDPIRQNIGISGDRIAYIGERDMPALEVIDAGGLYISPGFIDVHAHSEFNLLLDGRAEGKISQGVTTEINGNCGFSAAPLHGKSFEHREQELKRFGINARWNELGEYFKLLKERGLAINFATLCGHGNLRASVVGYENVSADQESLKRMKALFCQSLLDGAYGLSTGLVYPPGIYSGINEIIEILKVALPKNKIIIYTSHMRSEGDTLLESIDEVIQVAKESRVNAHISHLKTSGEENWWKLDKAIQLIEDARGSGIGLTCDSYPYIASSTDLDSILPSWVFAGGVEEEIKRLKKPEILRKVKADLALKNINYWRNIYISSVWKAENKWMEGVSIYDISLLMKKDPVDTVIDIIISEKATAGAIFFMMSESNLMRILALPYCMIGTDSSARSFTGPTCKGKPHPRGFGTFPRFIGYYVREKNIMPLAEAIKKITSFPAKTFGINARGIIKVGFFADIVIFDYNQIKDNASYKEPFLQSDGIKYVFVNGDLAVREGKITGLLAGRVLT